MLKFADSQAPSDLGAFTRRLARAVYRALVRRSLLTEADAEEVLGWHNYGGFSVDTSVRIPEWDRRGLERLLRYCARPAFAASRLTLLDDGRVHYELPKPDVHGGRSLVLNPLEVIHRLRQLLPPPRVHRHVYFGAIAPNCHLRPFVTLSAGSDHEVEEVAEVMGVGERPQRKPSRSWAALIARIYEVLPLLCPHCGGEMKIISFIVEPAAIRQILKHLERKERGVHSRDPPKDIQTSHTELQ